jgi:hypothetical protein
MHRDHIGKPLEIRSVESKKIGYSMHFKHRCNMRVVDLNAAHFMNLHQLEPSWKDRLNFFQERHVPDNRLKSSGCLLDGQSKAIAVHRASAHVPKLTEILRSVA